jgi:hypothetical protein
VLGEGVGDEAGAYHVEIEPHPEEGSFADGDVAVFGSFPAANEDSAPSKVDVSFAQLDEFVSAQRRGVEQLKHRSVPQAEGPGDVRRAKHCGHLFGAEGPFGEATVGAGHDQICCRVGGDTGFAAKPGEQLGDGHETLHLRAEAERRAVMLAVQEELLLVGVEEFERHCLGRVHPTLFGEGAEVAEIALTVGDGGLRVVVDLHPCQVVADVGLDRCHGHRGVRAAGQGAPGRRTPAAVPPSPVSGFLPALCRRPTRRERKMTPLRAPTGHPRVGRYYDPGPGQFLTRDPLDALTQSAYGYVADNPLNGTDPSGLDVYGPQAGGGYSAPGVRYCALDYEAAGGTSGLGAGDVILGAGVAGATSGSIGEYFNSAGNWAHLDEGSYLSSADTSVAFANGARGIAAVGAAVIVYQDVTTNKSVGYTVGDVSGTTAGGALGGPLGSALCGGPETGVGVVCGIAGGAIGGAIGGSLGSKVGSAVENGAKDLFNSL